MAVIHYNACPVCGSGNIREVLETVDNSVSGEHFRIWECADCSLRFTQDVPDAESIGPYYQSEAYISHSDTNKGLVNNLYHRVRRHTLKSKLRLLTKQTGKKTGRLLDIGAGTGAFARVMQDAGWLVTGLEPDAGARAIAQQQQGMLLQDAAVLSSLPEHSFDAITLWHVLEHVHALHSYIDNISRLLATDGKLFLALPNYISTDAEKYGKAWAAYDTPRHLYHFSPAAVRKLLLMHGMALRSMHTMWFDPFYISMLSESYAHGRANHASAFLAGLRSDLAAMSKVERSSSIIYIAENRP